MVDIERFSEAARFARKAVEGGAHFAPPPQNQSKLKTWERKVDITLTYLFGKDVGKDNKRHLSLEDVGKIFPGENGRSLTKQRVRQIVAETTFDFWQNSTDDVKEKHPWERLKEQIAKPKFLTTKQEGIIRNVLEDLDSGADYGLLSKKYSSHTIGIGRRVLKKYGIAVPFYESGYATLIKELEAVKPATDNDTLKKLQGKVDYSFMQNNPDIFDLYFIPLSQLLRNIGFYFRHDKIDIFLDKLGESGVDVGHIEHQVHSGPRKGKFNNYYFVFRLQEERIRQVLLSDPDLSNFLENPVWQIAGVRLSELPNTTQLRNDKDYKAVLSLCWELRIRVSGRSSVGIDRLLEDCLVPVFANEYFDGRRDNLQRELYYPSAAQEVFKRFLLQKAARLKLVKPF